MCAGPHAREGAGASGVTIYPGSVIEAGGRPSPPTGGEAWSSRRSPRIKTSPASQPGRRLGHLRRRPWPAPLLHDPRPLAMARRGFPQRGLIDVRFAPKATEVLRCRKGSLCARSGCEQSQQTEMLFDHLVGNRKYARWNGEAERRGSLEVDDELELGRLLHRQIGGIGTFENLVHIAGSTPI
jgi:hypothetical protein